jgi:alpha-L-arabinofuranosidase
MRLVVETNVVGTVDDRLFGQFLERPFGGEAGPEHALVPGTNRLQPRVVELMKEMRIPIIRFPGGIDVDYTDWRDMISNVPGRAPAPDLREPRRADSDEPIRV